ncbi:calcium-translocating P-type ATPase, SERCA-type [Histomonas meleagridis]|uniref:calcium-translocating P-type ATPase, SERCA-type n=1 Tax=Histomonas meleagridis TaxID=135588 RepID=UPI00355A22B7|nr:calcium-translocating P-type ATPase, SERCA-type [Histomonas meleagridis]KAH0806627.1 calcium-translocating P-type ATPase, SERCA-type [Histomonas meleagridis]
MITAFISIYFEHKNRNLKKETFKYLSQTFKVHRNNHITNVNGEDLVCGDIIELSSGNRAPAGLLILNVNSPTVEYETLDENSQLTTSTNREGEIIAGSSILKGNLQCLVIKVSSMKDFKTISVRSTPSGKRLISQLNNFSKISSILIIVLCFLIFLLNVQNPKDTKTLLIIFRLSLALAIVSIPENLSLYLRNSQIIASHEMSKNNTIVIDTHSIDTIGNVSVLCYDLFSTLASDILTVNQFSTISNELVDLFHVENKGYQLNGRITQNDEECTDLNSRKAIEKLIISLMLIDQPGIIYNENNFVITSSNKRIPSLQIFANKLMHKVFDKDPNIQLLKAWTSIKRNKETEVIVNNENKIVFKCDNNIYKIGNYQKVLNKCKYYVDDETGEEKLISNELRKKLEYLCSNIWAKQFIPKGISYKENNNGNHVWISGIAISNLLRKDALSSIELCKSSDIKTILISNEDEEITSMYSEMLRFPKDDIINDKQWSKMSNEEKKNIIKQKNVFCGFSSAEKIELINHLKENNEFVGFVSTNVDDISALRSSDVGITLSNSNECIRGVSSMILKNNSLNSISKAAMFSRSTKLTSIACLRFILSCGIAQIVNYLIYGIIGIQCKFSSSVILVLSLLTLPFTQCIASNVYMTKKKTKNFLAKSVIRFVVSGIVGGVSAFGAALYYYSFDSNGLQIPYQSILFGKRNSMKSLFIDDVPATLSAVTLLGVYIMNAIDAVSGSGYKSIKLAVFIVISISLLACFTCVRQIGNVLHLAWLEPMQWLTSFVFTIPLFVVNFILRIIF